MSRSPKSVPDLIDAFGGPTKFAEAIGLDGASTASEMRRTGRISSKRWVRVVAEAKALGIPGVTYEFLAHIHADESARQAS